MITQFHEIINNFAQESEFPLNWHSETKALFNLSGIELCVLYLKGIDKIIFQMPFAQAPENNKEKIYFDLLKQNNLFQIDSNLVFGLDENKQFITLQFDCILSSITQEQFGIYIANFITLIVDNFDNIRNDIISKNSLPDFNDVSITNSLMNMVRV